MEGDKLFSQLDENPIRVIFFIKEPDTERVIFKSNQVHRTLIECFNSQHNTRTAWTSVRFDRNPIVNLHNHSSSHIYASVDQNAQAGSPCHKRDLFSGVYT